MNTISHLMSLSSRDARCIWHPYTPMKLRPNAVGIVRGEGVYLYDESGKAYIDAVSSWWVNLHGHSHPEIAQAISKQANTLAHCMFANLTHEPAVLLAEQLLELAPNNMQRVFYSDNGSCATEIAIKMALQAFYNRGQKRKIIVAFEHSYHGDTFGAMSASARGLFTQPFDDKLFQVVFIPPPRNAKDEVSISALQAILDTGDVAALIVEPLVQGASGMSMHSAQGLAKLFLMAKSYGVYVIADEVMTGFGRTGTLFACEQLMYDKQIAQPDILCLSKGLTGGTLPLAVTLCTDMVFDAFYTDDAQQAFYHGHSYTANPIACAAALASLRLTLSDESVAARARIGLAHYNFSQSLRDHPRVADVRCCGTIFALTVRVVENGHYLHNARDQIYHYFLERGILLRPIGNVLYLIPPYCITKKQLDFLYQTIREFLNTDSVADLAIV